MFCPNCGQETTTKFCAGCGAVQPGFEGDSATAASAPSAPPPPAYQPPPIIINNTPAPNRPTFPPKNRWVAFFLCLFLGVFGIHRFYTGKVGTGIIYLLTCGLAGIGVLIDLIVILAGGFTDKYGNPLVS